MSKQTMVMVLSEHAEISWGTTGMAHCGGCDMVLCSVEEPMVAQDWKLWEHQADMMLDAGLGLTRPAEAEGWETGFEAGFDYNSAYAQDPDTAEHPQNTYVD